MQKNNKAFTLVELIVVITILAILGTIAFINLQGYSTSARDSKRVSDINNIMKKIGIESSKGTSISSLINTTKTNSGLTIDGNSGSSIQGTANFLALKEDGNSFKDPVTNGDYVLSYSVGGSGTGAYKFNQISTVNEEENTAVVKGNYYKMQSGDSPSITYNPDSTYFVEDGGVNLPYEIVVGTTNESVFNPYDSCTGVNTPTPFSATTTYSGCDTADIIVCAGSGSGYTTSACNVGATTASTDWTISRGEYFQWGRNKGFAYNDMTQQSIPIDGSEGLDALNDEYGFVWDASLPIPYSWANTDITDNWGNTTNTSIARQGPCARGYHVPSNLEWSGIVASGLWFGNGSEMQNILKLPYSGSRFWNNGTFGDGSYFGLYWSSSYNGVSPYLLGFDSGYIDPNSTSDIPYGFSVRCFKN
ncbi:MAG: prepilin-type N-terminal cleavage/methylation domain-containing protein [Candidatus Gracilibacteria bacterium]|nr:prepilin-type N-terminal cleavage/methylation domain-containing protein [Candidatus Gracilibacteria bacterium]